MNIFLFIIVCLLLIGVSFLVYWIFSRRGRKAKSVLLAIPLLILIVFALSFIPHKVVSIDPASVSKITIFNGNTGQYIEIAEQEEIHHIINNLNEVTFQKGKPALNMGFSYRTTIYDNAQKAIKELVISSSDSITYRGFHYQSINHLIDYDFVEELFRENVN